MFLGRGVHWGGGSSWDCEEPASGDCFSVLDLRTALNHFVIIVNYEIIYLEMHSYNGQFFVTDIFFDFFTNSLPYPTTHTQLIHVSNHYPPQNPQKTPNWSGNQTPSTPRTFSHHHHHQNPNFLNPPVPIGTCRISRYLMINVTKTHRFPQPRATQGKRQFVPGVGS